MAKLFKEQGLPFIIKEKLFSFTDRKTGKRASIFSYSCPWLDKLGRCSNYANRPQLCRVFKPQVDEPCLLTKARNM